MSLPIKNSSFQKFDDLWNSVKDHVNFDIRLTSTYRSKIDNTLLRGKIVCSRFGHYAGKKITDFNTKRCNCPFSVTFNSKDGVYNVTNVIPTHNHGDVCMRILFIVFFYYYCYSNLHFFIVV